MAEHLVWFDVSEQPVRVATGTLLVEAAESAGIKIAQPCGGQGRCGRCALLVTKGSVRRRSTLRLTEDDVAQGYALACQSVIESDIVVSVPPQEKIERRLTTDRIVGDVSVPAGYNPLTVQTVRCIPLTLTPPRIDDQTDDWGRLQVSLRQTHGIGDLTISLPLLRQFGKVLREGEWRATAILDADSEDGPARLIEILPGHVSAAEPLWGAAIDIGTTTISLWLVDLISGQVKAQVAEYNGQIARGEDVISRIVYATKGGADELRDLVLETINSLLDTACKRVKARPAQIVKATVAGNSTMMHLLLGIPAESIRLSPFITGVNHVPTFTARDVGLLINPEATVDCLPGVASYVGADITAGVLSSGTDDAEKETLFIDVGTNGEIVLGTQEWLAACACSAGPAFEGAGVLDGMRATTGAIEEVWINAETFEPTSRVIGGGPPRGICGSGLISLLAEMLLTGVVDKAGRINMTLPVSRVRQGLHGPEYVVAWAGETQHGKDIAITHVDIDNLIRAKAAIYAGFNVLADSVGISLESVEQILIGGSFGKYINVEKAVEIGLLPDLPWDRFQFLGNTSVKGAYLALLDKNARDRISSIARRMTYIELSADNTFYDAFMSASFLPHTDLARFPSVEAALVGEKG
jgi:uncharacterized 2Fe-2S/4Fe-4S cluster protein (DUF4445 family)